MHPAPSVIAFTTLSGAGFGLLFFLGIGALDIAGWSAFWYFLLGFSLSIGGLISSTFHLGHPERAWKAFSQWRSSWLSREAVAAVAALFCMVLHGFALVFLNDSLPAIGWTGAMLSLVTVFTTSMIYAQMKTVPRWRSPLTPTMFLSLSIAGGALLGGLQALAVTMLLISGAITLAYWLTGGSRFRSTRTSVGTATGLGAIGEVRPFEPPHTGPNYLLDEFVFRVARKHLIQLRAIAFGLAFVAPVLVLLLFGMSHPSVVGLAFVSHLAGVFLTRWVFFAEAEHVVHLYYGASR